MRFDGTLVTWNDDRGFGTIEPTKGGERVFVHVSAWPKGAGRPQVNQALSFAVEQGPKGKRAKPPKNAVDTRVGLPLPKGD